MSGGSQTSTQKTEYDPAYMARINTNYDRALNIANTPFQPYTGERVAGFSPLQQQGQGGILAAANDPTGTNMLNRAGGILGDAIGTNSSLQSFSPRNVTAPTVDVQKLSGTDLQPYMNPFQKNVIDATMSQLGQQRGQQEVADNASATAAHAFGGSRQGVQRALTAEGYDRNTGGILAGLNSDNFRQAQSAALSDIGQQNTVGMFNAGNAFDASRTNAANDITGAGLRLNASNAGGGLASQLAAMSDQHLNDALRRAGVIEGVGAEQTAQDQARADAAYEEFIRQLQYPYQTQELANQALGAYPVQATTTNTTKKSGDVFGGILGAIAGGAKIGSQFYGGG